MTWKGYFFRLTPRSSSASTNVSELNPEATVFISSGVHHQAELTDGTTYINSLTTPEQQQSEQPLQQIKPRRTAHLHEKRSAETARVKQLAPKMTSTDADEYIPHDGRTSTLSLINEQTDDEHNADEEQQILADVDSSEFAQQPQTTNRFKGNFVFDSTLPKTQQIDDDDDEDPVKTTTLLEDIIKCYVLKESDYINDDEFRDIYIYLKYDKLTNNTDRIVNYYCYRKIIILTTEICIRYLYQELAKINVYGQHFTSCVYLNVIENICWLSFITFCDISVFTDFIQLCMSVTIVVSCAKT